MDLPNLNLNLPDSAAPGAWAPMLDDILRAIDANMAIVKLDMNGTSQTVTTAPNFIKILFSHAVIDTQGWFDSTNHTIKPTVPCTLLIALFTGVDDGNSGTMIRSALPAIYKNNSVTAYGSEAFMTSATIHQGRGAAFDIITFDGTSDFVDGRVYCPTGANTIMGDTASTRMFAIRLK